MPGLVLQGTDIFYPLSKKVIVIGRSSQCDITICDDRSSRKHCKICKNERGYHVRDMASYNGTYVNEEKIHDRFLEPEDKIKIGKTIFIYRLDIEYSAVKKLPILLIQKKKRILQNIPLAPGTYSMGRSEKNDIVLSGEQISSMHVTLFWKNKKWWLQDLHSKNGTYLNHKNVNLAALTIGDVIDIGDVRCTIMPPGFASKSPRRMRYFIAAAVIVILLLLVFHGGGGESHYRFFQNPDNLVDDFSFEDGSSWELRGAMEIKQGRARSGRAALFFSQGNNGEALYQESILVAHNCAYRVSAWTKFDELLGLAGVKITWLNKELVPLGNSFSPLLTRKSPKWQKIEFVTSPPPDAEKWRVSCFVLGSATGLFIDDVEVVTQKEIPHLSQEDIQVFLGSDGIGKIYWQSQPLLEIGYRGTGLIATGQVSVENDSLSWKGSLYRLDDFSMAYNATIRFIRLENNIELTVAVTLTGKPQNAPYSLTLPFSSSKKARINNTSFDRYFAKEPAPTISYLVWKTYQSGIIFTETKRCSLTSDKWGFHVLLPEDCKFSIENLRAKNRQVSNIKKQIEQCQKQGQFGNVMRLYHKIVTDFAYHVSTPMAKEKLRLLGKNLQIDTKLALHILERAYFFHNIEAYAAVIQKCRELWQKWQGIEESQKFLDIAARAEKEKLPMVEQRQEKFSQRLLRRAQDLEQKQPALAWMFYREILESYPGSQNIRKAKAKSDVIEKRLPKLANFFSKKRR